MADSIAYWKNFWRDLEIHGPEIIIPEWHTSNEGVFNNLAVGNNIWVIVQAGDDYPDEWRLLQKVNIESLEIDTREDKYEVEEYGHFHADGDKELSKIFDIDDQKDFTPILHHLEFARGRRLNARGKLVGRSFQSLRPLTENDGRLLEAYSKSLKLMFG